MDVRPALRFVLDTYVIDPFAYIPRGLEVPRDRDLIVGRGTRIDGAIRAGGRVFLANGVEVRDEVRCAGDLVVGARCTLLSPVHARADAVLLDAARIASDIHVGGSATVLGARVSGNIHAGGDIEVRPPAVLLGTISCGGRVRTLDAEPAAPPLPGTPSSSLVLEPL